MLIDTLQAIRRIPDTAQQEPTGDRRDGKIQRVPPCMVGWINAKRSVALIQPTNAGGRPEFCRR